MQISKEGRALSPFLAPLGSQKYHLMHRTPGFEPHSGQTVSCPCARHIYSPKVLVIPRKRWLRPNMTEISFTGTLRINQPTNQQHHIWIDLLEQ